MKALGEIAVRQVLLGDLLLSDVAENESGVNKTYCKDLRSPRLTRHDEARKPYQTIQPNAVHWDAHQWMRQPSPFRREP